MSDQSPSCVLYVSAASLFSLLLTIRVPSENTICLWSPPVACSALYPNIHTVYSHPLSLQHTPLQAPSHLYAPGLRDSASVGSAERRPSQLPEVELPPFPREITMQYPCVWHEWVCVCCIFMPFFLMALPYTAVKLDPQWEFMKCINQALTLWYGYGTIYRTVKMAKLT